MLVRHGKPRHHEYRHPEGQSVVAAHSSDAIWLADWAAQKRIGEWGSRNGIPFRFCVKHKRR
jgi:hypothetical protein